MASDCIKQTQARLDELHSYGFQRQPVGALRAFLSAENNAQASQKLLLDDGKVKKYQITWMEPDCSEIKECGDAGTNRCDAGTSQPVRSEYKTIDECIPSGVIQLTVDQYRDLCNFGPDKFTMNQITGKFDKMARKMNEIIITNASAAIGCVSPDIDTRELQLINPLTGVPSWTADVDILADYMDAGMSVSPILIGGRTLLKYDKGVRAGSFNNDGVNLNAMEKFPMYYDNQLQGLIGTPGKETILAVAPQLVNVVNYLENVGEFQSNVKFDGDLLKMFRQGETFNHGVIQDPFTGIMYDMDVIYDACTKKWLLSFRSHFDVWVMRTTQCYADCFTGLMQYDVCPAPALVCPG